MVVIRIETERLDEQQRFAQRLKIDVEAARREVVRRMSAQLPDSVKIQRADFVIDNSGSLDNTEAQVRELCATLKKEAEQEPQ